jgi:hypothetical protein
MRRVQPSPWTTSGLAVSLHGPSRAAALAGATVVSRSPWKTIRGTLAPSARPPAAGPWRMAAYADDTSWAAPATSPEWIPAAAYRSG